MNRLLASGARRLATSTPPTPAELRHPIRAWRRRRSVRRYVDALRAGDSSAAAREIRYWREEGLIPKIARPAAPEETSPCTCGEAKGEHYPGCPLAPTWRSE